MPKKTCPQCKAEISERDKFCSSCGNNLNVNETAQTGKNLKQGSESELAELIKDSQVDGWRQIESILKLGNYKNEKALTTLNNIAFSEKLDSKQTIYHSKETYTHQYDSKIRWTAAESISKMGDYARKSTFSRLSEQKSRVQSYSESRARKPTNLLNDFEMLIWLNGELKNKEAIGIFSNIINSKFFTKENQQATMNALLKIGLDSKSIFIENLQTDEDQQEFRYVVACTALASFGSVILPDLLIHHPLDVQIRVNDILNYIQSKNHSKEILGFYLDLLSKNRLATNNDWGRTDIDKSVVELYSTIRAGLLSNREKSIEFLMNEKRVDKTQKMGIIRAMGLMDDAMFLQPLISFTQDNQFEVRDEALKWYKRLNHRLILYQDSSSVPEMASFERKKSYVDMTLIETEEYLRKMKESDFPPKGVLI